MATVSFKVGDSFAMTGIAMVGGVVQDMTGWTINSQIRRISGAAASDFIEELTCTWVDAALGSMLLEASSTADWPICAAVIDVRLTAPGGSRATSTTANINLIGPVTR